MIGVSNCRSVSAVEASPQPHRIRHDTKTSKSTASCFYFLESLQILANVFSNGVDVFPFLLLFFPPQGPFWSLLLMGSFWHFDFLCLEFPSPSGFFIWILFVNFLSFFKWTSKWLLEMCLVDCKLQLFSANIVDVFVSLEKKRNGDLLKNSYFGFFSFGF